MGSIGAMLKPSRLLIWFMSLRMVLTQGSFRYPCLADPALLLLVESQKKAHQQGEVAPVGPQRQGRSIWVAREGETAPQKVSFFLPWFF